MDVSGVGLGPAGFPAATPEAALDPQRSGPAGAAREELGQARQAPLDLLSNERLGRELLSLGLRPDPAKLLAARALVLQQGCLDPALLLDIERSLEACGTPGPSEAQAAAFLLARRLPANQETMSWVLGRQYSPDTAGARMIAIIQRFAAAMAARTESQGTPPKGDAPAPSLPGASAESQAKATAPSGTGTTTGATTAKVTPPVPSAAAPGPAPTSTPTSTATPTAASASSPTAPSMSPTPSTPAAAASSREGVSTAGQETPTAGAKSALPEPPKAPTPGASTAAPATPAPTPATPSPANAATPQVQSLAATPASVTASTTDLADAAPDAPATKATDPSSAPGSPAKPAEPVERVLLAKLQALALPEGKAKDVAATLRRLVQALRPPEADLARGEVVAAKERLSSLATKAIAKAPENVSARAVHDEIRFQQVQSARHEGQTPQELVIPLWWNAGSGEIRVQERPKGAAQRPGEESAPMRVVIALDTPHLGAVRIDLLLAQRQVNCLVAVQDQGAADFLSPRLMELRSAIEETGVHVHVMGMKPFTPDEGRPGLNDAKGVDYYW